MNERFDDDREDEAASAGSNAGKILTSTLWSQSGTVYVSVGGKQTALTGHTYNRFCPNYAEGSRAITGCSNTADAQILYYWIERGYDLALSVTTDNYFKIKNDSTTYYVSETSNQGEGTLSELNSRLGSSGRVGNGDFIEALLFFCGVNNHSSYGASTSTSWSYTVSSTGKCAASFVAAGFDSYYFIARKASGSVPGLFFNGTSGLTEVGLSIMRENLDYGEPIRIGVPNHAVYMDGYRVNAATGEYEYHINYGWGTKSAKTKWYTASELEAEEITYITIDLSPDVTVRVGSARDDYYGGSFLRGMERLNHIVNDRSTTFTFDSALAGETINLSAAAKITSAVDVTFGDICVSLATTATELFESARGMNFWISGGSLIVCSASAAYAIRETGNHAVNVSVENGFVYTGNADGGIAAVRSTLAPDGSYALSDFDQDFLDSVSGRAVKSGNAADTVTLKRGAALFGKLELGSGDNVLAIGPGSLFYGAFAGTANTLTVNLSIDNAAGLGATAALADSGSAAAFRTATGGVLRIDFATLGRSHRYDLLHGGGADLAKNFTADLSLLNGATELGTLKTGEEIRSGNRTYALDADSAGTLTLTVDSTTPGDLDDNDTADVIMTINQPGHWSYGATGAWLIQENQTAAWDDLSTRNWGWEIFGTGRTAPRKDTADVYIKSADNVVGAWTTGADGKVDGWKTIESFDAATQVLGLGDFDGDGQSDLLLRNVNGAVGCHLTDGTGWNYFQSLGDEWSICAVGDLNGDGRDDVVLKHDAGFAGSWLTQADCTMAWANLDTLPAGFAIVGTGDFDGDGTSDVLLQKGSYYGAWLVKNGNANSWMGFGELANATVEQIGDFDGDGKDDLRIRTGAGDLGAMLVRGEDDLVWKYYGSVGQEWSTSLAAI